MLCFWVEFLYFFREEPIIAGPNLNLIIDIPVYYCNQIQEYRYEALFLRLSEKYHRRLPEWTGFTPDDCETVFGEHSHGLAALAGRRAE